MSAGACQLSRIDFKWGETRVGDGDVNGCPSKIGRPTHCSSNSCMALIYRNAWTTCRTNLIQCQMRVTHPWSLATVQDESDFGAERREYRRAIT